MFFCEFYEIFQKRNSIEHVWMKAEWKFLTTVVVVYSSDVEMTL